MNTYVYKFKIVNRDNTWDNPKTNNGWNTSETKSAWGNRDGITTTSPNRNKSKQEWPSPNSSERENIGWGEVNRTEECKTTTSNRRNPNNNNGKPYGKGMVRGGYGRGRVLIMDRNTTLNPKSEILNTDDTTHKIKIAPQAKKISKAQ